MKKQEKVFFVQDLAKGLKDAKSLVIVNYQGLPNIEQKKLREAVKEAGGKFLVVKNTLLKLAGKSAGLPRDVLEENILRGPTALVIAEHDELAPLQAIGKFIQQFELPKLKIGILGGEVQDAQKLLALSRLPSREVLLGQLLATLQGPLYGLTNTLAGGTQMLITILKSKGGE